ncbi:MAG: hypothetical protein D6687_07770 [Acidobacteria bacterium]|jgi:hypothetical protein|nr:MAG: hypothetical protein D6687_07770 [Acidobacteriota bacterium]GIU81597.1 MAG: hypothetical protein KatS3mg006_0661 [Pyrinomonadaceae bacterium]
MKSRVSLKTFSFLLVLLILSLLQIACPPPNEGYYLPTEEGSDRYDDRDISVLVAAHWGSNNFIVKVKNKTKDKAILLDFNKINVWEENFRSIPNFINDYDLRYNFNVNFSLLKKRSKDDDLPIYKAVTEPPKPNQEKMLLCFPFNVERNEEVISKYKLGDNIFIVPSSETKAFYGNFHFFDGKISITLPITIISEESLKTKETKREEKTIKIRFRLKQDVNWGYPDNWEELTEGL